MSHKESKERTEKLLTCKLIKFQFTLVKFKYLKKKNVTNYTEISLFKIGHSHEVKTEKKKNESYCYVTTV